MDPRCDWRSESGRRRVVPIQFLETRRAVQTVLSQTFLMNERSSGRQINLSRQRIELTRRTQFACQQQLALPDHVHQFNAGEGHSRGPEGFEPEHRPWVLSQSFMVCLRRP